MKIIRENKNGSTSAIMESRGKEYFIRFGDIKNIENEAANYGLISSYFPVPKLIAHNIDKHGSVIIYEKIKNIAKDKGLLTDVMNSKKAINLTKFEKCVDKIIKIYKSSIDSSLQKRRLKYYPNQLLFHDRLKKRGRFNQFYANNKRLIKIGGQIMEFGELKEYKLIENNRESCMVKNIFGFIKKYKFSDTDVACLHGDPNETNITSNAKFLDLEGAGLNPVSAEFAVFIWRFYAQSNYLSPRYNPRLYDDHSKVFNNLHLPKKVSFDIDCKSKIIYLSYKYQVGKEQTFILKKFIHKIVNEYYKAKKFKRGNKNISELKWFILLRVLGTYDIFAMDQVDMFFSLSAITWIYKEKL